MKKLLGLLVLIVALTLPLGAFGGSPGQITTKSIWSSATLGSSGTLTSKPIDLNTIAYEGYFSLQYAISATGAPTVKFEYLLSNDGTNFFEPSGGSDIASGLTKTSGPGSDGKDLVSFTPPLARWLKILATESGGAAATISVDLAIQ